MIGELKSSYVELKIIDSGSGIDENIAKKIFDPFFTTKNIGRGMGLGLSVAYGIASDHGGNLFLSPSQHTSFVLQLPCSSQPKNQS